MNIRSQLYFTSSKERESVLGIVLLTLLEYNRVKFKVNLVMSPFILMDLHTSPPPVHPPTLLIVSVVKQVNRTLPPGVCVSKLCHFWQFSYSAEEVVP